jgi:hypothetical protein
MARLWLFGHQPEQERRGSGPSEDRPAPGEPTHQKYQLDPETGKPTAYVNCYCNATSDHPHGS